MAMVALLATTTITLQAAELSVLNIRISSRLLTLLQDNSKMDLLVEQLDSYRKNGIPKPNILSCEEDDLQRKLQ